MRKVSERIPSDDEMIRLLQDNIFSELMVALPGIVQSFDPIEQTVSVQISIKEKLIDYDGYVQDTAFPILVDIPIVIPRAGGYSITFPIKKGDECLVIFADMCIDSWWKQGGIQTQADKRRHDLSDGFAIMGCWSQPRTLSSYSTNSMQIRNDQGNTLIEVKDSTVNISATNINITGITKVNGVII